MCYKHYSHTESKTKHQLLSRKLTLFQSKPNEIFFQLKIFCLAFCCDVSGWNVLQPFSNLHLSQIFWLVWKKWRRILNLDRTVLPTKIAAATCHPRKSHKVWNDAVKESAQCLWLKQNLFLLWQYLDDNQCSQSYVLHDESLCYKPKALSLQDIIEIFLITFFFLMH